MSLSHSGARIHHKQRHHSGNSEAFWGNTADLKQETKNDFPLNFILLSFETSTTEEIFLNSKKNDFM